MPKGNRKLLIAIYIGVAIYVLPMFPHNSSANELTRWATAASIVERGTFDMAWTASLIGPNVDTARVGSNVYSNKAPGTAILAVPFYAAARIFVGPPDASNIRFTWFVMRLAISTLPLLILALWLYRGADTFSLAALLFASPLFIYSLLFFSHLLAAVAVYFAFRLLYDDARARNRSLIAGALAGLAVVCEFPAIFPIVVFAIGILFMDKDERFARLGYFVLGGTPLAILLLAYNYSLFGSPFSMSYAHESFPEWAEVANTGVFGIGFPKISNVFLLLFSPSRGLFFFAPVLILGLVGFLSPEVRSTLRHRVKFIAILFTVLLMSGHGAAHGGWAFGPRYLVLIVPLLLDSLFDEGSDLSKLWHGAAFVVSFVFCTLPILTFPFAPPEFSSPHNDFWLPLLIHEGWYVPNLANVVGVPSGLLSTIPILAAFWFVVYLVAQRGEGRRRFKIGLGIGVLIAALYFALPLQSGEDAFRRATVAERFFRPGDRLSAFEESATSRKDRETLARINDYKWNIADTRSYAPDGFPYEKGRDLSSSPTALMRDAIELQKRGNVQAAELALRQGKDKFPFAACEFGTNLAVIYYTSGRKSEAMRELESVQALVFPWSRPDCTRSRQLLDELNSESIH
ncbi:MAG: hypothetical protein ABI481_11515 [Pyrinomonadaceae bacterium]